LPGAAAFGKTAPEQGHEIGPGRRRCNEGPDPAFFLPSGALPDIRCGRFQASPLAKG
jgi:hypothetical protein